MFASVNEKMWKCVKQTVSSWWSLNKSNKILFYIIIIDVVADDTYYMYWAYLSSDHLFQAYYKVRQVVIQSAMVCYYKVRQVLLQSATEQCCHLLVLWRV